MDESDISDGLTVSETLTIVPVPFGSDSFTVSEQLTPVDVPSFIDNVNITENLRTNQNDNESQNLSFSDFVTVYSIYGISDGVSFTSSVSSFNTALNSSNLSFSDSISVTQIISISDSINFSSESVRNQSIPINSNVSFADSSLSNLSYLTSISDALNLSDSYIKYFIQEYIINDVLNFRDNLLVYKVNLDNSYTLINPNTDTYCINYENNAVTRYSNFNFNSYVKINGKYYGARADGLYLLDNDNDDGLGINSKITTGLITNSTGLKSRLEEVYLYIANDGTMNLAVDGSDGQTYYYNVAKTPNQNLDGLRVKLGKGRNMIYWKFELSNNGSSRFDLDGIKMFHILNNKVSNQN